MTAPENHSPSNLSPTDGSCVCGQVRFRIAPPYRAFQYCHCSRCRKTSGSAHASNIFVPVEQFAWLAGQEQVRRHELQTARYYCTGFCAECGSRLPWVTRNGKLMIVPAGALDADPGERPSRNVHFASRAPWYTSCADLPTFDAEPR
ncbi:MAG: GFA family protein [Myxococcales bacterium]|nr:GFA family protein [Myxococcales bacterium]